MHCELYIRGIYGGYDTCKRTTINYIETQLEGNFGSIFGKTFLAA
jgi:hypothetical protein